MAADVPLVQLLRTLQEQVPDAEIVGVNQNQAPSEPLVDLIELTIRLNGHEEPLVFRTPYADLHGGFTVVTLNAFVQSLLRVYLLGTGLAPETIVPMPGDTGDGGPLPPGPVLP